MQTPTTVQLSPAIPVPIPAKVEGVDWMLLVPVIVTGLGLLLGQFLRKISDMVVINKGNRANRLLIFRSQTLLHQRRSDQIAYSF